MAPAYSCVALLGASSERDNGLCPPFCLRESYPPALALMPDTLVFPCMPLVPFKLLPQCWSSEGVSLSKSLYGFFKRNCLGLQKFLPLTQSLLVFVARSFGDLPFWHWNPGLGLVLFAPKISFSSFYPQHSCRISLSHVSTPPSTSPCLLPVWMDVVSLIR